MNYHGSPIRFEFTIPLLYVCYECQQRTPFVGLCMACQCERNTAVIFGLTVAQVREIVRTGTITPSAAKSPPQTAPRPPAAPEGT